MSFKLPANCRSTSSASAAFFFNALYSSFGMVTVCVAIAYFLPKPQYKCLGFGYHGAGEEEIAGGLLSGAGVVALVRWLDGHPLNVRVREAWH